MAIPVVRPQVKYNDIRFWQPNVPPVQPNMPTVQPVKQPVSQIDLWRKVTPFSGLKPTIQPRVFREPLPVKDFKEREERAAAFRAYRKAGGKLLADQWEFYGMPATPEVEPPRISEVERQETIRQKLAPEPSVGRESRWKDIWDRLQAGAGGLAESIYNTYLRTQINRLTEPVKAGDWKPAMEGQPLTEQFSEEEARQENIRAGQQKKEFQEAYSASLKSREDFRKAHPEEEPVYPKGFFQSAKEDPKRLLDPTLWAETIAGTLPYTVGLMAIAGNPAIGIPVSLQVTWATEGQEIYEDAIANGATPEQAQPLSEIYGALSSIVETVGDTIFVGGFGKLSGGISKLLGKNVAREVAKEVIKETGWQVAKKTAYGALIDFLNQGGQEAVEQVIRNAAVKTVNEGRPLLQNVVDSFVGGVVGTIPFVGGGVALNLAQAPRVQAGVKEFVTSEVGAVGKQPIPEKGIPKAPVTPEVTRETVGNLKIGDTFTGKSGTGFPEQDIWEKIAESPRKGVTIRNITTGETRTLNAVQGVSIVPIPTAEAGMPEAGLQPSVLPEEVAGKEVFPTGKGVVTQISMEDQLKLEQAKARPRVTKAEQALLSVEEYAFDEVGKLSEFYKDNPEIVQNVLYRDIKDIEEELGLRSMPYHGRAKNKFPEWNSKQLDRLHQIYSSFLETTPKPEITPKIEQTPVQPPPKPPAVVATPEPGQTSMDWIISEATEKVRQDRQSVITNIAHRIPGIKQLMNLEAPGLEMTGETTKFLTGWIGKTDAQSEVSTRLASTRIPVINQLKKLFGNEVLHKEASTGLQFTGTVEQAKNPLVGKLLDVIQRASLYKLTDAQRAAISQLRQHFDTGLDYTNNQYKTEIGKFEAPEGSAYLPNVDIDENVLQTISERRALVRGRGKTRYYASAADRWEADHTFKPELDIQKLIEGVDQYKAEAAGNQILKTVFEGKTKLEVMQETHPKLFDRMMSLRNRLNNLRNLSKGLNEDLIDTVDTFLNSGSENEDLDALSADLTEIKVTPGRHVAKTSPDVGKTFSELRKEMGQVKLEIASLRPAWKIANLKPYQFVQEGIYRYFKSNEAKVINQLQKTTNNPALNVIEGIRGQRLSLDGSVFLIQDTLGIFADPFGSVSAGYGALKKAIETGKWYRSASTDALMEDIRSDPQGWSQFAALKGMPVYRTPDEFRAGLLGKIPGFSKVNEDAYITALRGQKCLYDRQKQTLINEGTPELEAQIAACDIATKVIPQLSSVRLGQSQARNALLRALPTSYSFIRQPVTMTNDATTGIIKLGLRQTLTPREKLSVKLMLNMATTIMLISATSAALRAWKKREDIIEAVWDAIQPKGWYLYVGDWKFPLGGPFRAYLKAISPGKVSGIPFPMPFAGFADYVSGRITPFIKTQIDLLRNKDYYGNKILKGDFPEQLLRGLEYEIESSIPLTAGGIMESLRLKRTPTELAQEAIGNVAGTSILKETAYTEARKLKDKIARQATGMDWATLGLKQGKYYQQILIDTNPELQKAITNIELDDRFVPSEEQQVWRDYEAEQKGIADTYQQAIVQWSNEYKKTRDGQTFRLKVDSANSNRNASYALLEKRPQYQVIRDYYNAPPDVTKTNPLDIARNKYYQMMYSPDMYDQFGNYRFDKADQVEEQFIRQYGQDARDYIDKWRDHKIKQLTPEYQSLQQARQVLKPYWQIEDRIWSMYPAIVKQLYDQIKILENVNPAQAKRMMTPAILRARELIAQSKKQWLMIHPSAKIYLDMFYR